MSDEPVAKLTKAPVCIHDIAQVCAERWPDHSALVEASGTWNSRELVDAVVHAQKWLSESGVRSGDRVMIVCENSRAFVAILFAVTSLSAWPVLVNARLSVREVDEIREHCGARRIIYTMAVSPHAAEHAARHEAKTQEVAMLGQIAISDINAEAIPEPVDPDPAQRVAALIYTSGTTGVPKGVMLTHRNLLFVAEGSAKIRRLGIDDRVYGVLPMSHAVGLSVVLLGSLLSGSTLYLVSRFDPVSARMTLEKERITVVLGVPSTFTQLLQYAKMRKLEKFQLPALRIIASSGAPLDYAVKADVEKTFGLPLHNGYGVTECSPNIAQADIDEIRTDTSVGKIFPGVEVKLIGGDGKPVPEGEVGELYVHGPGVMRGYYRAAEETAAAVDAAGWFNTRDLARLEGRNLFIVGRTKDLIVHSGFNVYPAEVEAVLNSHFGVMQSAVIGRPVVGDEEVIAFVQLSEGADITPTELAQHAAKHLAPYKWPSKILIVPSMPLTPTGKIAKTALKKMAEEHLSGKAAGQATARATQFAT